MIRKRLHELLFKKLPLNFDRSFSGKGMQQLVWLGSAISLIFALIYLLSLNYSVAEIESEPSAMPLPRLLMLLRVFVDPGSIEIINPELHWLALIVAVLGLILFCGILISVISNMLERRVERYRAGEICYSMSEHIIIIGFDEMVPSLISQICADRHYDGAYIVIQSKVDAESVRSRIHTLLDAKAEKRIVVQHAERNSVEELKNIYTHRAREIFIIGEQDELDHDSLNIDCLKVIVDLHRNTPNCPLIPVTVLFEYQTTFAAFKVTDLSVEWRKYVNFRPINFYESWAKKVLVERKYVNKDTTITYPRLDRNVISYDSEEIVHLVVIGMSRMGIALGIEAAQLMHFPNFCRDKTKKTKITFIDPNADAEMNYFYGRYRHFFEINSSQYAEIVGDRLEYTVIPPTSFVGASAEFLDVEFSFINARAEHPVVQNQISRWAINPLETLTVAVCSDFSPSSVATGLYLPDEVYDNNTTILVRQDSSPTLINMLSSKTNDADTLVHKFSHVFPMGMLDNCYDLDPDNNYRAKLVNHLYNNFDYKNLVPPSSYPVSKDMEETWNSLSVANQWSNLYCAYSISTRLRSMGVIQDDGSVIQGKQLTDSEIDLLANVEHNRWCVEKLLLGFRKPKVHELAIISQSKAVAKMYKEQKLVHTDLVPYNLLSEDSRKINKAIAQGMKEIATKIDI